MSKVTSSLTLFDRIRIINLPQRTDRRRFVTKELEAIGEAVDGDRMAFFAASRPANAGGFDTIGAQGCFLSHLNALREARRDGVGSLLLLEDDVAFSASERAAMQNAVSMLEREPWSIFYGGSPVVQRAVPLTEVPPDEPVSLTHFVAFTQPTIGQLVPYLEAMLERPTGSAEGGPMHVDGAYSWFRANTRGCRTFAATPHIAHQRASATDIHVRRGMDRVPVLRQLLIPARALKNMLRKKR